MATRSNLRLAAGELPLLPLRSMTLLPGCAQPVELGRPTSVAAVQRARNRHDADTANLVIVGTQREALTERPELDDLHAIAVLAEITQALQGVPGRMTAIVHGLVRVRLLALRRDTDATWVRFQVAHETMGDPTLAYALAGALQDLVKQHDTLLPNRPSDKNRAQMLARIGNERSPGMICDLAATHVGLDSEELVEILRELSIGERLRKVMEFISHRIHVLQVRRDLDRHVRDHMSRHEQEALLRHKLRTIQSELGDDDDDEWLDNLEARLDEVGLPIEARSVANRELARLRRMNPQSGEATIARTYLELIADLPWSKRSEDKLELEAARALLEREHYGLDRVKHRIVEYLCVRKLAPAKRGPILCLAGPPGVGKTSLARSIALALGRQFVRAAMGGVRDDAEIRGHRRTYVGALPGRIIQCMKRAGTSNPVFLIDEIDKLAGADMRGDPAGALLETLDPEQNDTFEDHYLGIPFDLSQVIFVCTANDISRIPRVLADRLEIIELSGYTTHEKIAIGRDYLFPKALREHGLGERALVVPDAVLETIATQYTRESGVRNLQRELESLLRDVAMEVAQGAPRRDRLDVDDVARVLGPPKFHEDIVEQHPPAGVVTGLGWTPNGGCLLFIEATSTQGDGHLRLTGRLGEVMRESGQTALSLVRSRSAQFGIAANFLERRDVHVHVPSGGVPKDGSSAGIALTTALVSHLTSRPVRTDIAMTGEVTLRGYVLPVGGVREKVLAAHRAGILNVVLPLRNAKDEADIPEAVLRDIKLHYFSHVDQVLELALLPAPPAPMPSAEMRD